MIKTFKHLRFMLVMLLATLGMNVAFGADINISVDTYGTSTSAEPMKSKKATSTVDGCTATVTWAANSSAISSVYYATMSSSSSAISTNHVDVQVTAGYRIKSITVTESPNGTNESSYGLIAWDNDAKLIALDSVNYACGGTKWTGAKGTFESHTSDLTIAADYQIDHLQIFRQIKGVQINKSATKNTYGSGQTIHVKNISLVVEKIPAAAKYTVTFNANGGTCGTGSLEETAAGAGVTLPSATPADEATQEFRGWAVSSTETDPAKIFAAGTKYEPADDVTLYAIYGAKTVKSAIEYAETKGATNSNPTQYTEGVGIAEFAALGDVDGWHFTGWNPASISASATGMQTITAEWEEIILPCATMGPITSSVAVGSAPVSGLTLSDASVSGKTVDANGNGLKLGGNDSRLKVTLNDATIVEGTKIVIKYKNPSANSGIGVFNGDYAHKVIDLTGVSATGSVEHTFTAAEAANYSDAFIITRNGTGASNYINAIEVYGCGAAAVKHHVTYAKGDASVTGTLPTQADVKENGIFTVASKGDLAWAGHTFTGWNDGSADYAAGDTYTMGTTDVTLTAQWEEINCSAFQVTCTNGQLEPFEEWLEYTRDQNATADIWAFNLVAVTGGTVATYEWYRNTIDAHEGENLVRWNPDNDGEYKSQYSKLPAVNVPGVYYYFCKVTSTDGCEAYSKTITYTVNAVASSEKKLTRAVFSNGFDAFIDESAYTVKAYYLNGETAPTLSVENLQMSAAATAAIDGTTITVTAEDGTTQDYAITLEAVTPATGGVYVFDAVPAWVKAPNGYDASKGIKFAKNADDGRIQLGKTRQYYFVASCEKLILHTASGITSDRNITVYVNNVKVNEITKAPKYNAAGSYIEIPCNNGNAMVAIVSNQTGGDGGFGKAEVVEYIKSTDATLSDLTVNSATVEGFDAATETYNVELPFGTVDVPTVAATKNDEKANDPVITPAASLPGATTVVVTAEDGTTTKTYTINFTVLTTHYVAEVGTTKCETVAELLDAVAAIADATPTTITLLDNVDLAAKYITIKPAQEVTLNLNGFMLENTASQVILANGKLTITGNGTIRENKASSASAIKLSNAASLVTLENGTLTNATSTSAVVSGTNGQFVMNDGTIIAPGTAVDHKNVDIKGGTITAADNALCVAGKISGGTITSTGKIGVYGNKSGNLEITGGVITGATAAVKVYTTNVKVVDATINNQIGFATNATGIILAGTDEAAIPAEAVFEVYENNTLLGYATYATTGNIGKPGQTLKLTADITTAQTLIIYADVLDLNGHNITSTAAAAITVKDGTLASAHNLTIKGNGNVTADNGAGCVAVYVDRYVNLTIEGGNYSVGGDADNAAIYVYRSVATAPTTVTIKGGTFSTGDNNWILNRNDQTGISAQFTVIGGTFAGGFDPANNNVDGPNTNYCPENFGGVLDENGNMVVQRIYTFTKWDGTSVNFEKKNAADELEFTVYSTNTGGRQNGTTALVASDRINRTDATLEATVLQTQQFVIKFAKDVKQVKLYAYNGNTGRALDEVKVTDADKIDATPSWSDAGFTLTSNTLATDYDYEYIIDGHFEAGKFYFIHLTGKVSYFDIFYTVSEVVTPAVSTITAVEIGGEALDATELAAFVADKGATLAKTDAAFAVKVTETVKDIYDDGFEKLVDTNEYNETAVLDGDNFVATLVINGETYTVSAPKMADPVAKIGTTAYETLQEAVDAAENGEEIVMLADVDLTAQIEIADKAIALDLAGHLINYTGASLGSGVLLVHNGAALTINDSSDPDAGAIVANAAYAAVQLTKKNDDATNAAVLVVNGGTLTGKYYAVVGNGSRPNTEITINGGMLTAVEPGDNMGIYHPQCGTLTINGGTIEAETGIAIKAGVLTINGGTIHATGANGTPTEAFGNGVNVSGAAIQIESNNGYGVACAGEVELHITDGTITSDNAPAIYEYVANASTETHMTNSNISGGTFNGAQPVYVSAGVEGFIAGGTFNQAIPAAVCAAGFEPKDNGNGTYGVKVQSNPLDITESMAWDFQNKGAVNSDVNGLNDGTYEVLASKTGVKESFNGLYITANFAKVTSGYIQAKGIKFHTTVPGFFVIEFANTGSSERPNRELYINGVATGAKSKNTTHVTYTQFVEAGDVVLTAFEEGNTWSQLNFYKITFQTELADSKFESVRTLSSSNIGTICLEKGVAAFKGATFYEIAYVEMQGGQPYKVFFDQVEKLEAGRAYIFEPEEDAAEIMVAYDGLTAATPVAAADNNGLQGTFTGIEAAAENVLNGNYIINSNKIRKCAENCYLNDHRAYIVMSNVLGYEGEPAPAPAAGRKRISLGGASAENATDLLEVLGAEGVQKVLIDGAIYIIREGQMYNVNGVLVK